MVPLNATPDVRAQKLTVRSAYMDQIPQVNRNKLCQQQITIFYTSIIYCHYSIKYYDRKTLVTLPFTHPPEPCM